MTTSIHDRLNECVPAVGLLGAAGVLIGLLEAHARTSTVAVLGLLAVLVMAVLVSQFALRSRVESARLAGDHVAFRRIASLVAGTGSLSELFETVIREVGLLSGADLTRMQRYEQDGTLTSVASWTRDGEQQLARAQFPHEGVDMAALVRERSAAVRVHSSGQTSSLIAEEARGLEICSSIGCPIVIEGRLWGLIVAASKGEPPFPAGTESQIAEFANLVAIATANANSRAELADLRARVLTITDDVRDRVRRDLHDGVQQRLVITVLALKHARQALGDRGGPPAELVDEALKHAERASAELRDLAHGSLPAALKHGGLRAAIKTLASGVHLPLHVDVTAERLSPALEATAYFIVAEALTNAIKHARASDAQIRAFIDRGALHLEVRDDGIGGARVDGSSGLRGLNDRAAALGGELSVESPHGRGTVVAATLPIARS